MKKLTFSIAITLLVTTALFAQDTAYDLRDLVGVRASSGESQLKSRGYTSVKTSSGNDRKWTNWWNNSRNVCVTVVTFDGRFDSIVTSPAADCNRGGNNGPGWGGGNGGGWNNGSSTPSWARGTWYWNGGSERVLTIDGNGRITVNSSGNIQYGWYRNNQINIEGEISTLSRNGNNIRTYNATTGEYSNYLKTTSGGGWNPGNPGGGGIGNRPPSWAVGTWYWNGGTARIVTITSDGRVTVNSSGSMQYGNYRDGALVIDGERSPVSQQGNNLRTYNQASGEYSSYTRNNNGGGWNPGNPGNGGGWSNPPDWAVGSWVWTNGSQRRLTVDRNGQVTAWDGNQSYPGYYSNGVYTINNQVHTLTRNGSRIRLYNQVTGDTYEYKKR